MVSVIIILFLLVLPLPTWGTTYYVATTGSDANNGTSEETAFRTVKKGLTAIFAGDTLAILNGTYSEGDYTFSRSGTASAPIKIIAYPGHAPVIYFDDTNPNLPKFWRFNLDAPGTGTIISDIHIEGLTFQYGSGVRWYNCLRCIIRNNKFDNNMGSPIGSTGALDTLIERNIMISPGIEPLGGHGSYITGSRMTFQRNIIVEPTNAGTQWRATYTSSNAGTSFAGPDYYQGNDNIIRHNIFAYSPNTGGVLFYGAHTNRALVENNIFFQNAMTEGSTAGIRYVQCCGTGTQIRNNVFYSSRISTFIDSVATEGVHYSQSGNVVGLPGFVNAPTSPVTLTADFRLTPASIAINAGRNVGIPFNGSAPDSGAFEVVPDPACSITANVITCIFPMSTNVPIQNLSTAGVTIGCTGSNCPGGGLTASGVARVSGTDTHVAITVAGFAGDACVATNQAVTLTYNSTTGTWTDNANIGPYPGLHQKIFSFASLAVTNQCTGAAAGGYPGTPLIKYLMEDGSGTTVTDSSGNAKHATLTAAAWGSGFRGSGVSITAGTTTQGTIPYGVTGGAINPSTQSMTWAVAYNVPVGGESSTFYVLGSEVGSSQRAYIGASSGTWRVGRQGTSTSSAGASNLAVTSGWQHLCVNWNSTTDTVTLYKNGVAGTGGATGSYTSFTMATDLEFPIFGSGFPTTNTAGVFDELQIYNSVEDCAAIYAAFQVVATPAGGTLAQAAVQFQGVYLDAIGNVRIFGALNGTQEVVERGGGVIVFQIHCQPGAPCDETGFKLVYAKNQTAADARAAGTYITVPNTETSDGFWFWGDTAAALNSGITTTRLTGSCTETNGATQLTADQVPSVALPSDGCIMLRYIFRVGDGVNDYFEPFLVTPSGLVLPGGYADGRINVVPPRGSAF